MVTKLHVLEILKEFKSFCQGRGWRSSERDDWVETEEGFHSFLWVRDIHPSSFRKIASYRKCVVSEGASYRVVEAQYAAWLFVTQPTKTVVETVLSDPDLFSKIALYDLSSLAKGKKSCARLNNTGSAVFREFEDFLENKLGVKVNTLPAMDVTAGAYTVEQLA
ncbi:MAG: hypothetical protein QHH24_03450 [Candidatus Bathyarchaeota archaeon]|nr:hypothetical protein [Candidatus Bathyarchaeota archaeon]